MPDDTSPSKLLPLADELRTCLPADMTPEGAASLPIGGLIGKVFELITAMQAGDWSAVIKHVRDILNILLADTGEGGGINFQTNEAAAAGIDWQKFIGVLLKLLPLILGAR